MRKFNIVNIVKGGHASITWNLEVREKDPEVNKSSRKGGWRKECNGEEVLDVSYTNDMR